MNFQTRSPLTPIELARRAAVLSAFNQPQANPGGEAEPPELNDAEVIEPNDERQYGKMAAQILRDARRSVALASDGTRFAEFEQAVTTLADAVAGQWLPKNVMVDRLSDIAEAHRFFGRDQGDIHG